MSNVNIYLFKDTDKIDSNGKGALKSTETDGSGTFKFSEILSGGKYKVVAHYAGSSKDGQSSKF
jgi:hypothetical protein